jgi:exodeoxyribonuclease VII large subunit
MAKNVTSQWDFGDLFQPAETKAKAAPPPPTPEPAAPPVRKVLTVSELTAGVRRALEGQFGQIWVTGEITNFRLQSSGHIYFTLKDANAQLSCVLFRSEGVQNRQLLKDGQKVLLQGVVTVYEPRGQYQLRVTAVELQGIGALQLAFERLKQKLQGEGLFAAERKRPIPKYPQRIGIVSSPTGAAIRDVIHVIERRHPGLELILASCRVQGEGSGEEIACSIGLLNEWSASGDPERKIDLILVTRGGGSLEDLWAFNEEVVARAIFNSALPVVSAVGHEIDFTISDFVADLRAATPSAAAEIITEGAYASRRFVAESAQYMTQMIRGRLEHAVDDLEQLRQRLARVHPRRLLQEQLQYLDDLHASIFRCLRNGYRTNRLHWENLQQRLFRARPSQILAQRRQAIQDLERRLRERAQYRLKAPQSTLATLAARLKLLSPSNVLARGYSITSDAASGKLIRAADAVAKGQKIRTRLENGEIDSVVD